MISRDNIEKLAAGFVEVASIAGITIQCKDIEVDELRAPHRPPSRLPNGKLAIYVFMLGDRCLKVGKVGSNSTARYCSHHYGVGRAPSTLAKSLLKDPSKYGDNLTETNVSTWIRDHTDRINFLIPEEYGILAISLFEVFVQCRLRPELEGFTTQRS
jgi:hypothetical protein